MPIESAEGASTEKEPSHAQFLFLPWLRRERRKKKLDVEAGRKKLILSACSPCRRLGAEGTACRAPQTQMSMSGPGSRPAEGAGAAGARPGGACRRPFLRRVELREEREEENEDILPVVFRSLNAPSFPRHLWPRGKNASSSRPRRRRLPCAGVLFTSIFLLFLP